MPQASGCSYSGCFHISEMSPASQIHDLRHGGQGDSSECSGASVGPGNLAVTPSASHSRSTLDSRGAADRSSSYLSGLEGNQLVASVVRSEEAGSNQVAAICPMLPVSQGQCPVTPQIGPTVGCAHQCQAMHLNSGDVLDDEDRDFLSFHIRKGTKQNYCGRWRCFSKFCNERMIEPMVAPPAIIVKFIRQLYKANLKYRTMNVSVSAISKHHVWLALGKTIAHHPVVQQAK